MLLTIMFQPFPTTSGPLLHVVSFSFVHYRVSLLANAYELAIALVGISTHGRSNARELKVANSECRSPHRYLC